MVELYTKDNQIETVNFKIEVSDFGTATEEDKIDNAIGSVIFCEDADVKTAKESILDGYGATYVSSDVSPTTNEATWITRINEQGMAGSRTSTIALVNALVAGSSAGLSGNLYLKYTQLNELYP